MRCANCEQPVSASYCSGCGQPTRVARLSVRALLARSASELTSFEQPLLRTLKGLLLHPGRVAADYVDGKRARYTNPIKWALLTSGLAFLVARLFEGSKPVRIQLTVGNDEPAWLRSALDRVSSNMAILFVLVMLPLLALSLRLCFFRSQRRVAEELVLVLYTYGCAALLQVVLAVLALTGLPTTFSGVLPLVWTAWAAVPFHREHRAWVSVLLTLLAHVVWILGMGLLLLLITLLAQLLSSGT